VAPLSCRSSLGNVVCGDRKLKSHESVLTKDRTRCLSSGGGNGVGEKGWGKGVGERGGGCSAVRLCEALYARHSIVLHSSVRITNAAHVSITTSSYIYIFVF
jgi:hypothetical protein